MENKRSMIDWLACALVKLIGGVLCRLPASVAVWLGERVGALTYWLQPKRARVGLLNLRAAFDPSTRPEQSEGARSPARLSRSPGRAGLRPDGLRGPLSPQEARRTIRACYRHLGATLVELLRLPVIDRAYIDRYITIEGRERFEAAATSGKPVILLTGHYGNWELSSILAALLGYPIVALARAQNKLPKLYQLLISYRESKGCKIIHKGGATKRLITALEQGQLIGIVGDQASRQGIFVDFFGRPALFATGPFELASKADALILPAFIHRLRGPFHRIVVEPPIELPRRVAKEAAVRHGVEQFARILARHIADDPSQWLWMHKRWKHTPARRILVLSDGKLGHLKQSLAVLAMLQDQRPGISSEVVEIRYRSRLRRAVALLWSWGLPGGWGAVRCLQWALHPTAARQLLRRYADCIISCGAATLPANALWAAENRAKSIVLMNPAPLPLGRFSLIIAPRHDKLPRRSNIVQTMGALAGRLSDDAAAQATSRLAQHPNFRRASDTAHPHAVVAVFIGGDTLHYELSVAFAESLMAQVRSACEAVDGWYLVTTSRRTGPAVERWLAEQVGGDARCRLLLIAARDPIDGTMEGMLGSADVSVVTGESISMVSEACAGGQRVIVIEPPLRQATPPPVWVRFKRTLALLGLAFGEQTGGGANRSTLTKHQQFLSELASEGYIRQVAVPELGVTIQRTLKERQPAKRLDNLAAVRNALTKLL